MEEAYTAAVPFLITMWTTAAAPAVAAIDFRAWRGSGSARPPVDSVLVTAAVARRPSPPPSPPLLPPSADCMASRLTSSFSSDTETECDASGVSACSSARRHASLRHGIVSIWSIRRSSRTSEQSDLLTIELPSSAPSRLSTSI